MFLAFLLGPCSSLSIREWIGVPVVIVGLLIFIGIAIDMVIHPGRHAKKFMPWGGGEMLREWNETEAQLAGLLCVAVGGWMLWKIVQSIWERCFG